MHQFVITLSFPKKTLNKLIYNKQADAEWDQPCYTVTKFKLLSKKICDGVKMFRYKKLNKKI